MKKLLIIILIFSSLQLFSQTNTNKFNYQFGSGISTFYYNRMFISFENEVNYKVNNYFTGSIFVNYDREVMTGNGSVLSSLQGNINLFLSPFKNNNKNNFKIGAGFSYTSFSRPVRKSCDNSFINDRHLSYPIDSTYNTCIMYLNTNTNFFDLNIILEDNYLIKEKYLIGLKIHTQIFNYYHRSGILLKLGIVL